MGLENIVKTAMEGTRDNLFKLAYTAKKFGDYYIKYGDLQKAWWYAT